MCLCAKRNPIHIFLYIFSMATFARPTIPVTCGRKAISVCCCQSFCLWYKQPRFLLCSEVNPLSGFSSAAHHFSDFSRRRGKRVRLTRESYKVDVNVSVFIQILWIFDELIIVTFTLISFVSKVFIVKIKCLTVFKSYSRLCVDVKNETCRNFKTL